MRALAVLMLLVGVARAERFAVIGGSTPLYREPRVEAAHAPLTEPTIGRVLGERAGGWVEVELSDATHCGEVHGALVSFHAFLRREALVPVVRRTIRHRFSDGTSVSVEPGAMWPNPLLDGIPIPSTPQDVGPLYEPSLPRTATPTRRLEYGTVVHVGGYPLPLRRWTHRALPAGEPGGVAAEPVRPGLLRLWAPCIELVAQVRGELTDREDDEETMLNARRRFDRVRAGAIVRWPDGAPAGTLLRTGALGPRAALSAPGSVCYEAIAVARSLVLCVAEGDVQTMRP